MRITSPSYILFILISSLSLSIPHVSAGCDGWFDFGCEVKPPYCTDGKCSLKQWVDDVGWVVNDLITDVPLSEYAQDIVIYLMTFISIIAVLYIIYAGFQILIGAGDEEKMKKAKNIVLYVTLGIILMWLSYSIVQWILSVIDQAP
jgi:type IV secretory pathway VirB2 component (pilin)